MGEMGGGRGERAVMSTLSVVTLKLRVPKVTSTALAMSREARRFAW